MDLNAMMKQAQGLQSKLAEAQAKAAAITMDGTSGGGLVSVTLNGQGGLVNLSIDPSLMVPGDESVLEDLIKAAYADSRRKLDAAMGEVMKSATSGLPFPIPGLKL